MKKIVFVLMCVCLAGSLTSFADTVVYYNDYNDPNLVGTGFPAWNWGDNGTGHNAVFADYNGNILVEHTGTIYNGGASPVSMRFGSKWDITMSGNINDDPTGYTIELDLRNVQGNWNPHPIEIFVLTKETGADLGYGLPTLDLNQADGWVHVKANLGDVAANNKAWWQGSRWNLTNPNWSIEVGGPPYPGNPVNPGESWTQIWLMDNLKITMLHPSTSFHPYPPNGATDVPLKLTLTWRAGMYAADVNGHKVYFDADQQKVTNRSGCAVNGVSTTDPCYGPIGPLNGGQTYYWAVDEVNDPCLWSGDVWRFTTSSYHTVEDFDSYADDDALRVVWKNVNNTAIYLQLGGNDANLVRDGNSMQYQYDNYGQLYSEAYARPADLPSGIGSNWTIGGVKALSLYFYGQADNDVSEPMYVKLTDVGNHSKIVYYDGDMNDIKKEEWQQWSIPLAAFTTVSPANVKRITIGLGDGIAQEVEDKGTVYFDEIRLYPPECILSKRSANFAKADYYPFGYPLSGDCEIDYQELEIMANTWLAEDDIIAPTTDPNIAGGLEAYYPMNEGSGTVINDANGNPSYQGTFSAAGVSWATPGVIINGNGTSAVYVNGQPGSRISIGTLDPVGPTGGFTLSIWAKWGGAGQTSQGLISKRDGWGSNDVLRFMFEVFGNNQLRLGSFANSAYSQANIMTMQRGRWAHIAVTFAEPNNVTFYLNGQNVGTGTCTLGTNTTATMAIGNSQSAIAWEGSIEAFNGQLDEARIYNRALSAAEIAYLADTTPGDSSLHVPVPSFAELYEGEPEGSMIVNFKDFAYLANMWLEQDLFP